MLDELQKLQKRKLARRDICAFEKNTYSKILDLIAARRPFVEAFNVLVDALQQLFQGKIPYQDLICTRTVDTQYVSCTYFMRIFVEALRKEGYSVNPGDRVRYVVIDDPTVKLFGQRMRSVEQYQKQDPPYQLDYQHYADRLYGVNKLFKIIYQDDLDKLNCASCSSEKKNIVHIISDTLHQEGGDLSKLVPMSVPMAVPMSVPKVVPKVVPKIPVELCLI